jgi:signal transduction histidine kinase
MPVDTDVTAPRLPPELETTAYFIVAEALTNVVKHSGAATATVAAHVRDRRLHLEIRDDGAGGVDAAQGSGIAGMSDRIAARNGTLDIVSPAGGGTRVTALLPLPAPAGAP